jgi:hypothetical protein
MGEGQVQRASLNLGVDLVVRARLEQRHLDARPCLPERQKEWGQQPGRGALKRADAEVTDGSERERIQVHVDRLHPCQDGVRVPQEDSAGFGQLHRSRAGEAEEHARSSHTLEVGDLLADGRLRIAQLVGCRRERTMPGNGVEGDEVSKF